MFCTQFGAQNAGKGISELPDFKIFRATMLPDPSRLRGLATPCAWSWLFFSNLLPTSNFIENPEFRFKRQPRTLCSLGRHFTFIMPLFTQLYKWVPANKPVMD